MIRINPFLRKVFYKLLGIVFLREWYVKRAIRKLNYSKKKRLFILDAGAGFGQYSYYCIRRFPNASVTALEINPGQVIDGNQFAEKADLSRLQFREADITKISFENRFELILNVDVAEHIREDVLLFQRFFNALKPGGTLVLSTPTVYRRHHEDAAFVDEHVREGYSEEEILDKLKMAGFQFVHVTYSYGFWGDLSWRLGIRNAMRFMRPGRIGMTLLVPYGLLIGLPVLIFMGLDYLSSNRRGTGFLIQAFKS